MHRRSWVSWQCFSADHRADHRISPPSAGTEPRFQWRRGRPDYGRRRRRVGRVCRRHGRGGITGRLWAHEKSFETPSRPWRERNCSFRHPYQQRSLPPVSAGSFGRPENCLTSCLATLSSLVEQDVAPLTPHNAVVSATKGEETTLLRMTEVALKFRSGRGFATRRSGLRTVVRKEVARGDPTAIAMCLTGP